MRCLFILWSFLLSQYTIGQINLDSFKLELQKTHTQIKSSDSWNAYVIKYLDGDSLVRHILPFNTRGEIEESIHGIALSSFEYDSMGRNIERRYYNKLGNLYFGDWPPIIRTNYHQNRKVKSENYYGVDGKPAKHSGRIEFDYDDEGDLIERRSYNGEYQLNGNRCITRYEFSKDKKTITTSMWDSSGAVSEMNGVAFTEKRYETNKRQRLLEERYHDGEKNLAIIKIESLNITYSIIRYTYGLKPNYKKIEYLDKNLKVVLDSWIKLGGEE